MNATLPIIISVVAVSLVSFAGIFLFSLNEKLIKNLLFYFVSFSTGVLFGDVFIHMIPELAETGSFDVLAVYILAGVVASFAFEKIIHWQHCHVLPSEDHHHPVGLMTLFGDSIHNFIDGMLIAGSFLISTEVGIATTVAIALHEIPQEIGDFALLLFSGYTRRTALFFNFISGLAAVAGGIFVLLTSQTLSGFAEVILAFAAGNFLYIAGTDLLPELHKETRIQKTILQMGWMIAGILIMYGLTVLE